MFAFFSKRTRKNKSINIGIHLQASLVAKTKNISVFIPRICCNLSAKL